MLEVVTLSFAFVFGILVRQIGLPPLVGFLGAGFALNAYGPMVGLPSDAGPILEHTAHLGVLLLLFTIGLKLNIKNLFEPVVLGSAFAHLLISGSVFTAGFAWLAGLPLETAILLSIALSFSSTVLAAKVLESKGELRAFHGRIAIGILVMQDLIALAVLSVYSGQTPSIWALWVLALPLLRPLFYWLMKVAAHDELLVLMGVVLAVAAGGMGFQAVGLSSEVGALAMGLVLSQHPRAQELSQALWGIKEVFLISFFLQIGMSGLPDAKALMFAAIMALLLPLKGALFSALLIAFRVRARNAFLGGLSLAAYSEFGLIVAASILEEWLVPLAVTVALSFVIAAPANRFAHALFDRWEKYLVRFETDTRHPDEQPADLGDANVLVLGMGRTGSAAYDFFVEQGVSVIGLDSDPNKAGQEARHVLYADVEDAGFWHHLDMAQLKAVTLAMPTIESKLMAAQQLRKGGFHGNIIAGLHFQDEEEPLKAAGVDHTYLLMSGAGIGIAEKTCECLKASA
ncbi:cation:proton antiporter [Vreelandella subglaciescola]|jgi:predicted Kef-type K+ transport protein|uniref:Transporter, CPA2 family n=1 Tax=Vreelandella subglaciescola TaxID=29571 RepID=A0A1M7EE21_9GAMM|nr:cation:proton antiporter [Halomonas subglaciescola]SHL89967.1 transporter, CPA2 family [Halomonas subglaciescola]